MGVIWVHTGFVGDIWGPYGVCRGHTGVIWGVVRDIGGSYGVPYKSSSSSYLTLILSRKNKKRSNKQYLKKRSNN